MGYKIADYPETWSKYSNEISLPVYFNLTDENVDQVIEAVKNAYQKVML